MCMYKYLCSLSVWKFERIISIINIKSLDDRRQENVATTKEEAEFFMSLKSASGWTFVGRIRIFVWAGLAADRRK